MSMGVLSDGLSNDKYGRTVTLSTSGDTDTYTVTDSQNNSLQFQFKHGTDLAQVYLTINALETIPNLATAITQKISDFQFAVNQYLDDRYTILQRQQFLSLFVLAQVDGLTNRAAYCRKLGDWANSVILYAANFCATVKAGADVPTVQAMTWDIDGNVSADPKVTLGVAIAIAN